LGMAWYQAIITISLANFIVLVPMLLNSHAGTKYGIPFPVFARASFGVFGANVAALLRAGVACGWFGIQTWIGGEALYTLAGALFHESWTNSSMLAGQHWTLWLSFGVFWILNIALIMPDFTRFGKSQRAQAFGQLLGLPTTMTIFPLIAVLITSATVVVYGSPIWDPIALTAKFSSPIVIVLALFTLAVATLSVNIAANVVSPSYDFSNAWPKAISFRVGGLITGVLGIIIQPWRLYS